MKTIVTALAIALSLPVLACSQDRACTEVGCANGFHLFFEPTSGWPAGKYTFRIEADGLVQTCEGTLPLPPCGERALHCSGPELAMIGESGCAMPADTHAFAGVDISTTPKSVRVSVERDGQPLFDRTFTPIYSTSRPNGPGCEPVCTSAPTETASLAL